MDTNYDIDYEARLPREPISTARYILIKEDELAFIVRGRNWLPPHFNDSRLCMCVFCGTVFIVRENELIVDGEHRYFDCPQCENGVGIGASYRLVREDK